MKVITFLNEKGGIGKTTLSTHTAAGLALRGYRTLLIDTDSQGHSTIIAGYNPKNMRLTTLYDLLVKEAAWRDVVKPVNPVLFGGQANSLFIVPATIEVRLITMATEDESIFAKRIREVEQVFDYVVIDTSPTPSNLHPRLLAGTDYVILPTQLETLSAIHSLGSSLTHIEQIRTPFLQQGVESVVRTIGIIPNMYREKTLVHQEMLKHLQDAYGELVWQPIKQAIAFAEANLEGKLLFAVAPQSQATAQINEVIENILAQEVVVNE